MKVLVLVLGFLLTISMIAQVDGSVDDSIIEMSYSNVHCSKKFKDLVEKRVSYNEYKPIVEGYRVQLKKSTKIEELYEMRSKFLELFPNEFVFIKSNMPYFLLRVGNHVGVWGIWEAKLHAELLKRYFSSAVYVRTDIHVSDLWDQEK